MFQSSKKEAARNQEIRISFLVFYSLNQEILQARCQALQFSNAVKTQERFRYNW